MLPSEFLGLERIGDERWEFRVTPQLCSFKKNLFGGAALAAATEALEATLGQPLIWATAQYIDYAALGATLTLTIETLASGRNTTQARALIADGSKPVATASAALGKRFADFGNVRAEGSFAEMPIVPPPAECPPRHFGFPVTGTITEHFEVRIAAGRTWDELDGTQNPLGRSVLWARMSEVETSSAASLALFGDFVPYGMGQALGYKMGGSSLDNTIRVVQLVPTRWVMLDIRIHAVHDGVGHGLIHIWAEDGTLLATASQSALLRGSGNLATKPPAD